MIYWTQRIVLGRLTSGRGASSVLSLALNGLTR